MKKRLLTIVLALVIVLACAFNVIACGGSSSSSSKDGTYYMYHNGEYSENDYVKISNNKVTDIMQEGYSLKEYGGKISTTISGKEFTATVTGIEDMKQVYSGEINNGVIHLTLIELYDSNDNLTQSHSYDYYFCKKNKTPDDINGNGGNSGIGGGSDTNNTPQDYTPQGFVPNNYPVDNSFKGAISEQSYSSKNAAAQGFLTNEISGEASQPSFVGYTTQATLSSSEISNFDIEVADGSRITSAERGEIEYEDNATATAKNASKAGGVVTVRIKKLTIYIFVIDFSEYKYFAPELNKGDVITKSYYDDVFDQSKYVNCTITETSTSTTVVTQTVNGTTATMTVTLTASATLELTETAVHGLVRMDTVYAMKGMSTPPMPDESTTAELYMEYSNGVAQRTYGRVDNGAWQQNSSTIDIRYYTTPKMDNSFFIKTDYGFTINSEKFSLYVQQQINNISSNAGMGLTYDTLNATAAYLVRDGKFDKIKTTVDGSYRMNGVSGSISADSTDTYTNFGTTVVQPKEYYGIL